MKFVIDNDCGSCNKLWSIVNPILFSYKKKEYYIFLSFDPIYKKLPNLSKAKYTFFPYKKLPWSLGYRFSHFVYKKLKNNQKQDSKISKNIIDGWSLIHDRLNENDIKLIRKIFSPNKETSDFLNNKFRKEREAYDYIIGVHIRRGDYKNYFKGKYYFNDWEYLKFMKIINQNLPGKKIFFISTQDKIDEEIFRREFEFFKIDRSVIEDLYGLASCDYIIGPPSTFSMWASMYGRVPISFITNKNRFNPDFKIIDSCPPIEEIDKDL